MEFVFEVFGWEFSGSAGGNVRGRLGDLLLFDVHEVVSEDF